MGPLLLNQENKSFMIKDISQNKINAKVSQFKPKILCPFGHKTMKWTFIDLKKISIFQQKIFNLSNCSSICNQCQKYFSTLLKCQQCQFQICATCSKQVLHNQICEYIKLKFKNETVLQQLKIDLTYKESKCRYTTSFQTKCVKNVSCFYCKKIVKSILFCDKCYFICCNQCRIKTKQFCKPYQLAIKSQQKGNSDELEQLNSKIKNLEVDSLCPFDHKTKFEFLLRDSICNICSKYYIKVPSCKQCNFSICNSCKNFKHGQICTYNDNFLFINQNYSENFYNCNDKNNCYYCKQNVKSGILCKNCYFFICDKCRKSQDWR